MRYSYEFKLLCVEMYHKGQYPQTPLGLSYRSFRRQVRYWGRLVDENGVESLRHNKSNKKWTVEEKIHLINQVMSGKPCRSAAFSAGINSGMLSRWVKNYKMNGYKV